MVIHPQFLKVNHILSETILVADIIYQSLWETPFWKWARSQGIQPLMVWECYSSSCRSFQLWTGKENDRTEIWQSLTENTNKEREILLWKSESIFPSSLGIFRLKKGCLAQAGQWLARTWQPQKVSRCDRGHVASLCREGVSIEDAGFQVAVFDSLEGAERKEFNYCSESSMNF